MRIKNAIISVHDKRGLATFARELKKLGVEIYSSGGTYKFLRQHNIKAKQITKYTGSPELLDGRVKTLHPKIYAGVLALRDNQQHIQQLKEQKILTFDLVVVNCYPFQQVASSPQATLFEALENIDIGGPSLIRAAAKNFQHVAVIVDPEDYPTIIAEMKKNNASIPHQIRYNLALKAFKLTSKYDMSIANYLSRDETFAQEIGLWLTKIRDLRYGENQHQKAALYRISTDSFFDKAHIYSGKELSYNNILDVASGVNLIKEFEKPTCAIIKHNTPCGVASNSNIESAFINAYNCDPVSAYGGIVVFNFPVTRKLAREIVKPPKFFEIVVAPEFFSGSIDILTSKPKWGKNLRILKVSLTQEHAPIQFRSINGDMLVQTPDVKLCDSFKWVSGKPAVEFMPDLIFAFKVAKHARSNAIVLCKNEVITGIGSGQTSRVDSAKIAIQKAGSMSKGSVLASDGFIPFDDIIKLCAKAGIKAIIQPGGSIRDKQIIASAKKYNIPMVFTETRHFSH